MIKSAFGIAGLGILPTSIYFARRKPYGTFLAGEERKKSLREESSDNFYLSIYDLDRLKKESVSVDFKLHDIIVSPTHPNLVVCPTKWNNKCALIDLNGKVILKQIELSGGSQFSGHGAFTPDGRLLYLPLVEYGKDPGEGKIAILNPQTLEILKLFPSYGYEPHDFCLVDSGRKILVLNSGRERKDWKFNTTYPERATAALIDPTTGKLEQNFLYDGPLKRLAHLNKQKQVAGNSLDRLVVCGIEKDESDNVQLRTFRFNGGQFVKMEDVEGTTGHFISIDIDYNSGLIAASAPNDNLVLIWDAQGKLVKKVNVNSPRGIAISKNGNFFVVGAREGMSLISTKELKLIDLFDSRNESIRLTDHITLV